MTLAALQAPASTQSKKQGRARANEPATLPHTLHHEYLAMQGHWSHTHAHQHSSTHTPTHTRTHTMACARPSPWLHCRPWPEDTWPLTLVAGHDLRCTASPGLITTPYRCQVNVCVSTRPLKDSSFVLLWLVWCLFTDGVRSIELLDGV